MKTITPEWTQELDRRREGMVTLRRDFHRHPELSFDERRTAEIIAERLHAAKLEVRTGLGRTGVVGVLRGDRPGRTIAWRADIDALPLTEILDAPFTSAKPGVMHACGHDGHTAIAITLAEILAARRRDLPGTAVFIFQPAEEVFGGAEPMIAAGVLEQPRVEEIYGLHLTTQTAVGQVGIRPGPVDGLGGLLRRGGPGQGRPRRLPASVDRSDHRRRQHPARHAEPRLARGGRVRDGGAHRGTVRRRHQAQHHPGHGGAARLAADVQRGGARPDQAAAGRLHARTWRAPIAPRRS